MEVVFTPHLTPMDRGILSVTYSRPAKELTEEMVLQTLRDFYDDEPFVRVVDHLPGTKDTVDTNFCDITARIVRGRVLTISCIDNLIKGALRGGRAELQSDVRLSGDHGGSENRPLAGASPGRPPSLLLFPECNNPRRLM